MAAVRLVPLLAALAACDDIKAFEGEVPPLATIHFTVDGDLEAVRFPDATNERLHVALVWGTQFLSEPLCFLPPESAEVEAVVAAGCKDPLGFVPDRAAESVPIELGVPGSISLFALPSADVMVGDVTARIAYASLIVFDDRNETGRLELGRSRTANNENNDPENPLARDIVYGSSFVSMAEPDVRVVLREGDYNERIAFYPRAGCGTPPRGFSVAGAGGFTREAAIAAALAGDIPQQDPSTCFEADPETTPIAIPLRPTAEVAETACARRRVDSSVRYREPPIEPLDFTNRTFACASVPDFGTGTADGLVELAVTTRHDDRCKSITHYVLRGCDEDAACAVPEWDITATPPAWWPCPVTAP